MNIYLKMRPSFFRNLTTNIAQDHPITPTNPFLDPADISAAYSLDAHILIVINPLTKGQSSYRSNSSWHSIQRRQPGTAFRLASGMGFPQSSQLVVPSLSKRFFLISLISLAMLRAV
jgi:hypothetical protein